MKIIDLLNKIANREEIPKKIKYKNKIYEWKEYDVCYGRIMTKKGWVKEYGYVAKENRTYFYLKHCYQDLNDEVEIIEEEKRINEEDLKYIDELNERIEKAVEYIEYNRNKLLLSLPPREALDINVLLDILNGRSDE